MLLVLRTVLGRLDLYLIETTLIMARRWKTTRNEPNVWLMSFILWLAANFIINLAAI